MHPERLAYRFVFVVSFLAALGFESRALGQAPPVIEAVSPTSGPTGTIVQINGRRFGPEATVRVGDQPMQIVDRMPNRLSVRIAPGALGGIVSVTTATGTVRGSEFRVTPPPASPVIDSILPVSGPPGTRVALRGHNFSTRLTANVVTLAGHPVVVLAATPDELQVTVPDGAVAGTFNVRVEQAGTSSTSSQTFQVTAPTAITDVKPPRGGPGAKLTIKGTGFSKTLKHNRVYLNNVPVPVESASETELVVKLPAKAASGKLLVDVEGAGRAYSAEAFVVQRQPKVVDFKPKRGSAGTWIRVRGTNFGTDPAVVEATIGETKASVREVSDTSLELQVPEGAKDARLSIAVRGVGPAWSENLFTVAPVLRIARVTPETAPAGAEIVIEGEGFGDAPARNRVTIGNQVARVVSATPTQLKVVVPRGKGGVIQVTVPGVGVERTANPFVIGG
jgi:hypothetical protein